MAGKGIILTIVMIVVSLFVVGAIFGDALIAVSNTTALEEGGVSASTIALFGLIGLIAVVAIIMLYLKIGTGGR